MNIKEKITIEDFEDKLFKIRIIESENEQKASFTHYLNNNRKEVSQFYK